MKIHEIVTALFHEEQKNKHLIVKVRRIHETVTALLHEEQKKQISYCENDENSRDSHYSLTEEPSDSLVIRRKKGISSKRKRLSKTEKSQEVEGPLKKQCFGNDFCASGDDPKSEINQTEAKFPTVERCTESKTLTLEEKDHLYALELQRMFSQLDKANMPVDRFKGSDNEYSFRRK